MKKTIVICDCCHTEILGDVIQAFGYDLCGSCAEACKAAVDQVIGSSKENDWGQAQALRDAGWTVADIARRLNTTTKAVYNHTVTPKKKKKFENEFNENEPAIMKSPELV